MKFDGPDLLRTAVDDASSRGLQNYKIDAASFELPSQLLLGVSYEKRFADMYKAVLISTFQNNNFKNDEYKLAAEFSFKDLLFLRGGYSFYASSTEDISDEEQNLYGPTFGAGINMNIGIMVSVDYAYRQVRYFDPNHVFAIKIGF